MPNRKWLRELCDSQRMLLEMFGFEIFSIFPTEQVESWDRDELIDAVMTIPRHFAPTVTGTLYCGLTLKETLTTAEQAFISSSDPSVEAGFNVGGTVTGVTTTCSQQKALSGGAVSHDLTSLTSVRGSTGTSFSGLKVKRFLLRNPSTNANSITATFGSATPAVTFGTGWKLILQPGDVYAGTLANSETVDGTHKLWDLTGTGSQALDIVLGAG